MKNQNFGGGKTIRDGMSQSPLAVDTADVIITNAVIIDYTGIYKADIGIKDGKISAIGKSGNPYNCDSITEGLEIGANTEILSAEGKIITAGGIDSHIHFISPGQIDEALASGCYNYDWWGYGSKYRNKMQQLVLQENGIFIK